MATLVAGIVQNSVLKPLTPVPVVLLNKGSGLASDAGNLLYSRFVSQRGAKYMPSMYIKKGVMNQELIKL